MIAVSGFHIFCGFVGRARGLFLSHVPSEMRSTNLIPQNLRATGTFLFINFGGEFGVTFSNIFCSCAPSCIQGVKFRSGFQIRRPELYVKHNIISIILKRL